MCKAIKLINNRRKKPIFQGMLGNRVIRVFFPKFAAMLNQGVQPWLGIQSCYYCDKYNITLVLGIPVRITNGCGIYTEYINLGI